MADRFNVIVIGGGSAGCVAASRLSEDPGRRVLLIERGPDPQPVPDVVADARKVTRLLLESPYIDLYPSVRSLDGSVFHSLAGRVMGGGSSVNMMSVVRPVPHDFDVWARRGNPEWSWEKVLPVFKHIESDQDFPDHPHHGNSGPLYVKRRLSFDRPLEGMERALTEGAQSLGLPLCPDQNVPNPFGVSASAYCVKDGKRQSAAVAYLGPARSRKNLTIADEALVTSLEVRGGRVTSVRYQKDGQDRLASGEEILLCAGVYHSPQILMLSGIGPASELERHGIRVVHPLEGVGRNFQDHSVVYMTFEGVKPHEEEWIVPGVMLNLKSDPAMEYANFHIIIRPPTQMEGLGTLNAITVRLLEQRTRGRVHLNSAEPDALPGVEPRMMEHPDDVAAMVEMMRFMVELARTKPMREFYGPLLQPGEREEWARYARTTYDSFHHGVGTCMMGPVSDPMAVVDQHLRVHGLENLRVADASIMPVIPHAHTNNASLMIGERVADFVKEGL